MFFRLSICPSYLKNTDIISSILNNIWFFFKLVGEEVVKDSRGQGAKCLLSVLFLLFQMKED
jgi:hypothetical protein